MSNPRKFKGGGLRPVRLIVSIEANTVAEIDHVLSWKSERAHPARGNRSEFVRLAIEEKLRRDKL